MPEYNHESITFKDVQNNKIKHKICKGQYFYIQYEKKFFLCYCTSIWTKLANSQEYFICFDVYLYNTRHAMAVTSYDKRMTFDIDTFANFYTPMQKAKQSGGTIITYHLANSNVLPTKKSYPMVVPYKMLISFISKQRAYELNKDKGPFPTDMLPNRPVRLYCTDFYMVESKIEKLWINCSKTYSLRSRQNTKKTDDPITYVYENVKKNVTARIKLNDEEKKFERNVMSILKYKNARVPKKLPITCSNISLQAIYLYVKDNGGYDHISCNDLWSDMCKSFRKEDTSKKMMNAANVKRFFEKYLLRFDENLDNMTNNKPIDTFFINNQEKPMKRRKRNRKRIFTQKRQTKKNIAMHEEVATGPEAPELKKIKLSHTLSPALNGSLQLAIDAEMFKQNNIHPTIPQPDKKLNGSFLGYYQQSYIQYNKKPENGLANLVANGQYGNILNLNQIFTSLPDQDLSKNTDVSNQINQVSTCPVINVRKILPKSSNPNIPMVTQPIIRPQINGVNLSKISNRATIAILRNSIFSSSLKSSKPNNIKIESINANVGTSLDVKPEISSAFDIKPNISVPINIHTRTVSDSGTCITENSSHSNETSNNTDTTDDKNSINTKRRRLMASEFIHLNNGGKVVRFERPATRRYSKLKR
ncbi:hypothetical protein A3Q56_03393 [Intoshia linei]|uniref:ARID domain-containing protein n=1 Tax=Intoshia linei TaxID=1819745 RepID=A0A177B3K9_9BILA|nr:hypothetical protein A3Q56_03393 [Intoshia linei]